MILNGMEMRVAPKAARMQLSENCPVTPEFRKEINEWMLEFFGTEDLIPDGQSYVVQGLAGERACVYMNQNTYDQIVKQFRSL